MAWAEQCAGPLTADSAVPVDLKGTGTFAAVLPDALRDYSLADAIVGQLVKRWCLNGRERWVGPGERRAHGRWLARRYHHQRETGGYGWAHI